MCACSRHAFQQGHLVSLIISYVYFAINKESLLYMKTETCIDLNKTVAC